LARPSPLLLYAAEATLIHPTSRKSASLIHILHCPGPRLMSIAVSDRLPSGSSLENSWKRTILAQVWPTLGQLAGVVMEPEVARVCDMVYGYLLSIRKE
jgi:hypothetical protein